MESETPSRFNNYSTTSTTKLTSDVWNASVGDLSVRMAAVEEKATGYDAIVNTGIGVALVRVNDVLEPAVLQISALIQQGQAYLEQLQASGIGAAIVTTTPTLRFTNDTDIQTVASIPSLLKRIAALEAKTSAPLNSRVYFLSTM